MAEVHNAAVFPMVLYVEERLIYVGNVEIRPALNFEQFRTMLNEMIGASCFHLTTCVLDNRRPEIPLERRKILVAGKVSFSVLGRQKNFNFIVELPPAPQLAPGDLLVLHLNHLHIIDARMSTSGRYHYEGRFHDLQTQSSWNVNMLMNSSYRSVSPVNSNFSRFTGVYSALRRSLSRELCEECAIAETHGKMPPFHLCVYDDIIYGFSRSPAGPIGRPQ